MTSPHSRGYIPEGSYFLQRELFENEVPGSVVNNYVGGTLEIMQRDEVYIIPGLASVGSWGVGEDAIGRRVMITQSFTPVESRLLTHVYLFINGIANAPGDLTVDIYDDSGGAPVGSPGNLLGSTNTLTAAQVAATPGGLPGWVLLTLQTPYRVAAGVTYHYLARAIPVIAPWPAWYLWSADVNTYAGGSSWTQVFGFPWVQQLGNDNEMKICGISVPDKLMMQLTDFSLALHNGKVQSNDFIQEIGFIFRINKYNTVGSRLIIELQDSTHAVINKIRIEDNNVRFFLLGTGWIDAVGVLTYEEWHMVRLFIHNTNSPYPNRVELFVDGFKYWENAGVLTNVVGTELVKEINTLLYEHRFRTAQLGPGDFWYIDSVITKDWADMVEHYTITQTLPYTQILIECNDHATFKKLGSNDSHFDIKQVFNKDWPCMIELGVPDINAFMEYTIKDDDSDDDPTTFTFDNEIYIFYQASTLKAYGYKAITTAINTMQDLNGDFVNKGVQVGDKIWFFQEGITVGNPHNILSVNPGTIIFEPHLAGGGHTDISYLISHGLSRVLASSLGDYLFIGRFKNFTYAWNPKPNLKLLCLCDGYIQIQKKIHSKSARYYQKGIDDLLYGHFKWESLPDPGTFEADQVVDGVSSLGNYAGLLGDKISDIEASPDSVHIDHHQAFRRNIFDLDSETLDSPMTKVWGTGVPLFEALASVCDSLLMEMQEYTDREYRNEREIFFRVRESETSTPIINIYVGELHPGTYTETETSRSIITASIEKGSRDFIDYVVIDGSTDGVGVPLVGDEPAGFEIDGFTRENKRSDTSIRTQNLVNETALAVYRDLNRKPEQGTINIEPTSLLESWFAGTYPGDASIQDVYQRQSQEGFFRGDSDWFHYGILAQKDRTTQGHLRRKPFTLLGEVMRYYFTATKTLNYIVNSLSITLDNTGMKFRIEPNVEPFSKDKLLADATRERDFISKQFENPLVQQSTALPLPKSFIEMEDYIGVGLRDLVFTTVTVNPAGAPNLVYLEFPRFNYQDESNSDSAYGYAFFYRLNAGPGAWVQMSVGAIMAPNLITDIDTTDNLIEFNNDPGGNYGYLPGPMVNYATCVPGAGAFDFMVVLYLRHTLEAGVTEDTPRQNPPDEAGVPGQDEMNQIIEIIDVGPYVVV